MFGGADIGRAGTADGKFDRRGQCGSLKSASDRKEDFVGTRAGKAGSITSGVAHLTRRKPRSTPKCYPDGKGKH